MKLKTYTPSDFPEVDCEEVEDLTFASLELLRKWKVDSNIETKGLENRFHQILSVSLKNKTKENVLESIKKIEKHINVLSVTPDKEIDFSNNVQQSVQHIQSGNITLNENAGYANQDMAINPGLLKPIFGPITTNDSYKSSWAMEKIQAPLAWNYTTGSKDVVVGILYDGVNSCQRDLDKKIDMSISRDYVQHCEGQDIMDAGGTQTAGIIGANANNKLDIAGLNWKVTMASIRVMDRTLDASALISGLEYASSKNIPIMNINYLPASPAVEIAVRNYSGLIVDFASYGDSCGKYNYYDNVISVGGLNQSGVIVGDTCEDKSQISLFAPSESITTLYDGGTIFSNEYSLCTAFVSGTAALMLAENPTLTASEIKNIIISTVDTTEYLSGLCQSGGSLNTYKAVKKAHKLHEYAKGYVFQSNTQHASYCGCGNAYVLEPHWAYSSSLRMYNGHRYATCACCEHEINIDNNPIIVLSDTASVELELMGLEVIESSDKLIQMLNKNFRKASSLKTAAVMSYYDEEFFETYAIVMAKNFDAERVVESLYTNIIECRECLDKKRNFWYNTDNKYKEVHL